MDRRHFVLVSGALCAGGVLGLGGCTGMRYVSHTREGSRLVVQKADFGDGPHALLENPQLARAIYLHRFEDGTFAAVLTRCTHRGCQVEPAGDRLACPCHGSEYTFAGKVMRGPAEQALYRYAVTSDAENIYIDLPDPAAL